MRTVSTIVALLLMLALFTEAKTIKVPQDYAKIQLAINAAVNGDTVLVEEGTYSENLKLTKKIVLGSLFITDNDTSHISKTILDGGSPSHADSASVIIITTGTDSTTVISGFTIQNGHGTRLYYGSASGYWRSGGGVTIDAGAAKIIHNVIHTNVLSTSDGVFGGGIAIFPKSGAIQFWIIEDNLITQNSITTTATSTFDAEGGGVHLSEDGRFARNTVEKNNSIGTTFGRGGGVYISGAPGYGTTNIQMVSNRIRGNYASYRGGGVGVFGASNATINLTMANNLITENSSIGGGGMLVASYDNIKLVNNTIANNSAEFNSGVQINGNEATNSLVTGINNIFWNPGKAYDDVFGLRYGSMHNSLIRGESAIGDDNFSADPMFATDGSYSLTAASPCIAAGTLSRSIFGKQCIVPETDINDASRPQPAGSIVDIGAVESSLGTTSALRPNRAEGRSFTFGGLTRSYAVVRPKGHEKESNQQVLMFLGGYGDFVSSSMNYYQMSNIADSLNMLLVYPQAYDSKWNSGIGDNSSWPTPNVDDVGFISALIDTLKAQYGVDTSHVYVTGHSNGGFMAMRLAATLAECIQSVVAVAAAVTNSMPAVYFATRQIPIMMINSTGDATVPYNGAAGWYSAEASRDFWRTMNDAMVFGDTISFPNLNINDGSTVQRFRYMNNQGRTMVLYYKITGGSHNWPGGLAYYNAIITRDIDANREIVKFITDPLTEVRQLNTSLPLSFSLSQNYPNPFNPSTTIRYSLPSSANVKLVIYDLLGREIAILVNEEQSAGWKEVEWNAGSVSSGIYFYKIIAGNLVGVKKLMLLK